jgi:DNA polymerase III delta prime subunit
MTTATLTPTERLLDTARRGELHHALILYGPSAILLQQTAMDIAKTLNCPNGSIGDDCLSCTRIERGVHPDVEIIAVPEERKMIAVEQIRDLISHASLRPYEGRTKVFIIESAEAMSTSGANALLKTLEEPTRDTVFLLETRSPDLLLPTIRSRSQAVHIRPVVRASAKRAAGSAQLRALQAAFPGMEPDELQSIVRAVLEALAAYAAQQNVAALLALAAMLGAGETADALAIYATVLRDLVCRQAEETEVPKAAEAIIDSIAKESLLRSADVAMRGIQRMVVNVDARLLAEQTVAALALKQ